MKTQRTIEPGAVRATALGLAGLLAVAVSLPAAAQSRYKVTDLGTLRGFADSYEAENCVNNQGHVAVYVNNADNDNASDVNTAHSLLWEDGTMINLQAQIPADSGWLLEQALCINERGQIGGFGWHNGQLRAYLLTPTEGCDGDKGDGGGQH